MSLLPLETLFPIARPSKTFAPPCSFRVGGLPLNAPFWWRCFPSFLAGKSKDRGGEKKREKRQKSRLVGRIVVVVESVFSRLMMDGSIVRVATTLRASSSTWPSYRACSVRPTQFTRSYLIAMPYPVYVCTRGHVYRLPVHTVPYRLLVQCSAAAVDVWHRGEGVVGRSVGR